jgi:ABC-type polysaccharide/polyol phosphate export permease
MIAPARDPATLAGLVWTLVRTDFKSRYHGTIGGFFWALLKPLSMFVVLMSIFSLVFASHPNYALHLIVGLCLWDFFAEATRAGLAALHARGYLLTKVRTPPWIMVVTSISNAVLTLGVFSAAIGAFIVVSGRALRIQGVLLYAGYLGLFCLVVIGISLATSVLFLRHRDLNQVWDVVLQAGFFAAPIIYPLAILPERLHAYLYLWPPTPFVQFARAVLVDGRAPTLRAHMLLVAGSGAILAGGALVFRRYASRAAEHL